MTTVAITGACGFIGKELARRALSAGCQVVGLDASPDHQGFYRGPMARFVLGDINDTSAVDSLCAGSDRVYHTAAIVKETGDMSLFERVNVEGTLSVAAAAERAHTPVFVHFSSVMVYGFSYPDGVDETGPTAGHGNPYCETKIRAEAELMRRHHPGKLDVYFIRPGDVYGPGSVPWTLRPVQMMRERRFSYVDADSSIFNHVYIDNLLDGVDRVLEHGVSGTPYNITDDKRTTVREFFSRYQKMLGVGFLPSVPRWLAAPASAVVGALSSALGRDLGINPDAVRYMCRSGQYSCAKIKALGYRPRVSLEEGMRACEGWLREQGLV